MSSPPFSAGWVPYDLPIPPTNPSRATLADGTLVWLDERGEIHSEDGPARVHPDGTSEWWYRGMLHRVKTQPAIERADGGREWWWMGQRHRHAGLPAIVHADGSEEYWLRGDRHRSNDLPAVISYHPRNALDHLLGSPFDVDGYWDESSVEPSADHPLLEWWERGVRHRENGPAVIHPDGSQEWYVEARLHRVGGPAVVRASGKTEWWAEGCRHRLDGPAVEFPLHLPDTHPFAGMTVEHEWWVEGQQVRGRLRHAADVAYMDHRMNDALAFSLLNKYPTALIATLVKNNPSVNLTVRSRGFAALLL